MNRPNKNYPWKKVITEAMLFNFLSFLTHTAHTEKADDKAKRDEDNRRHHKQKTYFCQDLKIELI